MATQTIPQRIDQQDAGLFILHLLEAQPVTDRDGNTHAAYEANALGQDPAKVNDILARCAWMMTTQTEIPQSVLQSITTWAVRGDAARAVGRARVVMRDGLIDLITETDATNHERLTILKTLMTDDDGPSDVAGWKIAIDDALHNLRRFNELDPNAIKEGHVIGGGDLREAVEALDVAERRGNVVRVIEAAIRLSLRKIPSKATRDLAYGMASQMARETKHVMTALIISGIARALDAEVPEAAYNLIRDVS